MKIEAVTICVDYSDFLAWSIVYNKHHFDRYLVVTSPADQRTRDLCEHHHVECVTTEAFYESQKAFDKGAGISAGLARLAGDEWIVHLDADIILPPRTRKLLERAELEEHCIYGADRLMCQSYKEWAAYVAAPEIQHGNDIFVRGNAFPLGVRVAKLNEDGYVPIGFFQMWHAGRTGRRTYPSHGMCDRSDMRFARDWPRRHRHLIPEFFVIHLESESVEIMGKNWRGRKSKPFCGEDGYDS